MDKTAELSENKPASPAIENRLMSLDILRGFDMFWIIGGNGLLLNLIDLLDWKWLTPLKSQCRHAEWHGFTAHDLIFPLFLFIAGVVVPFSLGRRLEKGTPKGKLALQCLRRCVILIVLGFICNGLLKFDLANMRWPSVLGLIGAAYFLACLVYLYIPSNKRLVYAAIVLLGFWALMTLVPVPEYGAGVLTPEGNLSGYIDRTILPGKLYGGICDPEGPLLTLPASVLAVIGVMVGCLLRSEKKSDYKKFTTLIIAGVLLVLTGLLWNLSFPIIKKIWTSSFIVFTAGLCTLLVAIFYLVIDIWKIQAWGFPFRMIGLNAITIYMLAGRVIDFRHMNKFFFGGLVDHIGKFGPTVSSLTLVSIEILFLYILYRKKIFLKV